MPKPTVVGTWIAERRADLDITQEKLADIIWCSVSYISDLESGKNYDPGPGILKRSVSLKSQRSLMRLGDALSRDDDDRATFLQLVGCEDHAKYPRLSTIVEWRKQFPVYAD